MTYFVFFFFFFFSFFKFVRIGKCLKSQSLSIKVLSSELSLSVCLSVSLSVCLSLSPSLSLVRALSLSLSYSVYSTFESSLSLSAYLNELKHVKARNFLIKIRIGVPPLRTHELRYRKDVTPIDYFCPFCVGAVETEVHFVLVCLKYAEIREQYIPRKNFTCPSSFKLALLLATTSKFRLIRLATYLMRAFTIRNAWIFSIHWLWRYVLKCKLYIYMYACK